jgi:hypothetical protein
MIFVIVAVTAIALNGCNPDSTNSNGNANGNANRSDFKPPAPIKPNQAADPNFKACNPYFPLVPGSIEKYVINYSSGIVGDLTIVVDEADENGQKVFLQRSQLIDRSGGTQITQSIVRKFVCEGGVVRILSEKTESNIAGQQSAIDFNYRDGSVMMSDPESLARRGSTWTHTFRSITHNPGQPPTVGDMPTAVTFTVDEPEEVTTGAGTFKAIKIIRKIGENGTVDFYVAGLGLVRRVATEGTRWELKEFSGLKVID